MNTTLELVYKIESILPTVICFGFFLLAYIIVYGFWASWNAKSSSSPNPTKLSSKLNSTNQSLKDLNSIKNVVESETVISNDLELQVAIQSMLEKAFPLLNQISKNPKNYLSPESRRFLSVYTNRLSQLVTDYLQMSSMGAVNSDSRNKLIDVMDSAKRSFNGALVNNMSKKNQRFETHSDVLIEYFNRALPEDMK